MLRKAPPLSPHYANFESPTPDSFGAPGWIRRGGFGVWGLGFRVDEGSNLQGLATPSV